MNLPDKLAGEVVLRVVHRDFFILLKKIVLLLFMLLLLATLRLLLFQSFDFAISAGYYPALMLGGYGFLLFAWLFFFFSVIDYYLDVWFITNLRIIDIRQEGFFSRKVSEQFLNRVQDVTSEVTGVLPTILNYGEVKIQTAGEKEQFLFEEVPEPEEIKKIIMQLVEKSHVQTEPQKN